MDNPESFKEPDWLRFVVLGAIVLVTVIGPIMYGLFKCVNFSDKQFQSEGNDARPVAEEETEEMIRSPVDQDRNNQGGEEGRLKDDQARKRRRNRASFARVVSIAAFFHFWVWLLWCIGCAATTCGLYSKTLLNMATFGAIAVPVAYIVMLTESLTSREREYINGLWGLKNIATVVSTMRQTPPSITLRVACYHYEARTRTVDYTSGGRQYVRTETYREQVLTHEDSEIFRFNFWTDLSAPKIDCAGKHRVVRIILEKSIVPGDEETSQRYNLKFEELQDRNRNKDAFMAAWKEETVEGFQKRIAASVDDRAACWWMKRRYFWLTVLLAVTWPYRWHFRAKSGKAHYTVKKKFYLTRPSEEGVKQCGVPSNAVAPEQEKQAVLTVAEAGQSGYRDMADSPV